MKFCLFVDFAEPTGLWRMVPVEVGVEREGLKARKAVSGTTMKNMTCHASMSGLFE